MQADGDSCSSAADDDSGDGAQTYVTAPSVLTPVPESPGVYQDENAMSAAASTAKTGVVQQQQQPAARWRRKNAAERQEAERRQHLAEMRAYFQEASAALYLLFRQHR